MPRRRPRDNDPADPLVVRARALRAVARREHGARELQCKLVAGGAPTALAEAVVSEFAERGWQSDQRYAEGVARTRLAQGYGPLRLRAELAAGGIDAQLVDAVSEAPEEGGWLAVARRAYARRFDTLPANAVEWQKRWHFLARRGFTTDQIRAVLGDREG